MTDEQKPELANCAYCYRERPTKEMIQHKITMHPKQRYLEKWRWYCDRTCAMKDQMAHEG